MRSVGKHMRITTQEKHALEKIASRIDIESVGLFCFDAAREGTYEFLFASESLWRMLGYESGEAFQTQCANGFLNIVCEEDRARVLDEIHAYASRSEAASCTYHVKKADGTLAWLFGNGQLVIDECDAEYFLVIARDMETVRSELLDTFGHKQILRDEAIQMYQRAIEAAQLAIWKYDIPARRIVMSETAGTLSRRQLPGIPQIIDDVPESLVPFVDEKSVGAFLELYRQINAGVPVAMCEVWSKAAPGLEPHCDRLSYASVFDESGRPVVAYGVGIDITSQKSAERRLQKEHDELESLRQNLLAASSFNATKDKPLTLYGLNASIKTAPYSDWVYQEAVALDPRIADQSPETLSTLLASAEQVIDPEKRREFITMSSHAGMLDLFNAGKRGKTIEYQRKTDTGITWVSTQLVLLPDPKTRDVQAFFYTRDIDAEKKNERIVELITSEDLDYIGLIHPASHSFELLKESDNAVGLPFGDPLESHTPDEPVSYPGTPSRNRTKFWKSIEQERIIEHLEKEPSYFVSFDMGKDASMRRKQVLYRWLDEPGGDILVTQRDITASYEREQKRIRQEALLNAYEHDPLTGLYSRDAAIMHIRAAVSQASAYTLVNVLIDNLRFIRDSYGYAVGDAMIKIEAKRVSDYFNARGQDCIFAHVGSGQFLIFVFKCLGCDDAEDELRALERVAREQITFSAGQAGVRTDIAIWPHTSIGAASSDGVSSPGEIWHRAGLAGEAAQDALENIRFYTDELSIDANRRREVLSAVATAVDEGALFMVYQPRVDAKTGQTTGFEALARMKNDVIMPDEFIPAAEEGGFISQVGRITTEIVIRQIATWRDAGKRLLPVSINYSSKQLGDHDYVFFLLSLLEEYDLPASLIEIEITENLLLRPSKTARLFFDQVKQAGIRILMDDFGSGYSSLSYLSYVPADVIKLDKSVIDTYLTPADDASGKTNKFIRDIILLMHDLGKTVTAEGIEHAWQAQLLQAYGCDVIQGFYYARPLHADAAIEFGI